MDKRTTLVLIADTEDGRYDDYRYTGDAVRAERAWDKYKRWAPQARAGLRDRVIQSAAAQDMVFVVIEDQKIDEGFRCTRCMETRKHTKQCAPPRGLASA